MAEKRRISFLLGWTDPGQLIKHYGTPGARERMNEVILKSMSTGIHLRGAGCDETSSADTNSEPSSTPKEK